MHLKNNLLSDEQRRAILRLIPKHGKDLTYLKHWRPISLLNTDYKILAQALALRMQKVLPQIISPDQNAYITGRFIGVNIRTIVDSIAYSSQNKLNTILAFLDFEKAFDKIRWDFVDKCLLNFGFGPNFRKWISIMYTDISSAVINNGYTTPYFKLKCGIRQGCPMSALIFILAVETLAVTIKKNKHIKGIRIKSHEIKITQLADDTTLILDGITSLQTALNTLRVFQSVSGLKLNYAKTEILSLGNMSYSKSNPFNLKWVKDRVYALGTWFYKDLETIIEENYKAKFEIFVSTLKQWRARNLTIFGKITVLKSLAISKMNYCIATLETPEWFTEKVQNEINDFIWNEKTPKIKYSTAIAKTCDGGLKVPDIHTYILAQKAIWARRLLNSTSMHFMPYLEDSLPVMHIQDILNLSVDSNILAYTIPLFYRQVLFAWYLIGDDVSSIADVLNEILWLNKKIKIGNESIAYDDWYTHGCKHVRDLLDENGHFYNHADFSAKYNLKCSHFKYMSLIDAIPKEWKSIIKSDRDEIINIQKHEEIVRTFGLAIKPIDKITSKDIYWKLLGEKIKQPTCVSSWQRKFYFEFTESEWKTTFKLPSKLTKDVKVIELQTKILHRVYACNSYVARFDKSVYEKCKICNVKCDICHMFYHCEDVKRFWYNFLRWWNANFATLYIDISITDVIFGILLPKSETINYCILLAKSFLHKLYRKCENNPISPSLDIYLHWLKEVVEVERYIAVKNDTMESFTSKFETLLNCL